MDPTVIWATASGIAGILGGFTASRAGAWQGAASINQLLQSRIDLLEQDKVAQAQEIQNLRDQVKIITDLVTQRAPVAQVQETVDRIEGKIDQLLPPAP